MEEQMCVHCEEYFDEDEMTMVYEDEWVCPSCLEENYNHCDYCNEYWADDIAWFYVTVNGKDMHVCQSCFSTYFDKNYE